MQKPADEKPEPAAPKMRVWQLDRTPLDSSRLASPDELSEDRTKLKETPNE
jgi:hypothetical protein